MLSGDPNTVILEYALDEEPIGEENSAIVEQVENGATVGETPPWNSWSTTFLFKGLSSKEGHTPGSTENDIRRLLDRFYAGGELRVYRTFPCSNPFQYPKTDGGTGFYPQGYSDITPLEVADQEYAWYDSRLGRFNFVIEGVEVK